ncbi:MAG: hypothetical protein PHU43_03015 [Candidatus Bipolaricaulis sp.]|nr:hypothetical protein [Candidatus Bipolaricaulis sp.]
MSKWTCLLFLTVVFCLIGAARSEAAPVVSDGLSVLFLLSEDYAANVAVWSTCLDRLGYEVTFAGVAETIPAFDYAGGAIHVDRTLAEIPDVSAFDAVFLATRPVDPGNIKHVAQDLRSEPAAIDLVRAADAHGLALYVGASAFGVLLDAGLVEGRSVLCHSAFVKACAAAGGSCAPSRSTDVPRRDGNLVTGTSWYAFPIENIEEIGRALDATQTFSRSLDNLAGAELPLVDRPVDLGSPATRGAAWGGNRADGAVAVCPVPGGFVLTGYTFSCESGTADILVARFDNRGELVWSQAQGGPGRDYGQSICATQDGGSVVAGFTTSAGAGAEDAFLVRYTSAGDIAWTRTFGGEAPDMGLGVCATRDGGFALCGYTMSAGEGESDLWIVRVDAAGTEQWTLAAGGTRPDRAYAIEERASGEFVVLGTTTTSGGNYDSQLWRISGDGQVIGTTGMGWSLTDVLEELVLAGDGSAFAVGYGDCQQSEAEGVVIASFGGDGAKRWGKRVERMACFDYGAGLLPLDSGDLLVCGTGATSDPTQTDALFMRLNSAGTALWTEIVGDRTARERIEDACRLETGDVVVVGHTKPIAGGSQDALVLFVDPAALP